MTEQYAQINANVRPRGARYIASDGTPEGSGPFDLTFDDDVVIADTSIGSPLVLTLPTSSEFEGFEISIHAPAGATANVLIQPQPGETVVGPGAVLLNLNGQAVKLACQFNFEIDVDDPDVPPVLIRRGWYCTGECAGRNATECPEIDDISPASVAKETGVQSVTMTGSFDTDIPDVLFPGTIPAAAVSETGLTITELDFDIDTDLVEPGTYQVGVFRADTNCFDFIEFTVTG